MITETQFFYVLGGFLLFDFIVRSYFKKSNYGTKKQVSTALAISNAVGVLVSISLYVPGFYSFLLALLGALFVGLVRWKADVFCPKCNATNMLADVKRNHKCYQCNVELHI
ncbi:MAG: hypothetical protein R3341_04020 [Methylophaga sp.]|nr:hypothetical protein [Methylophaga sp.]